MNLQQRINAVTRFFNLASEVSGRPSESMELPDALRMLYQAAPDVRKEMPLNSLFDDTEPAQENIEALPEDKQKLLLEITASIYNIAEALTNTDHGKLSNSQTMQVIQKIERRISHENRTEPEPKHTTKDETKDLLSFWYEIIRPHGFKENPQFNRGVCENTIKGKGISGILIFFKTEMYDYWQAMHSMADSQALHNFRNDFYDLLEIKKQVDPLLEELKTLQPFIESIADSESYKDEDIALLWLNETDNFGNPIPGSTWERIYKLARKNRGAAIRQAPSEPYRTKARAEKEAGSIDDVPKSLSIITYKDFQYSISFYDDGKGYSYLQDLKSADNLTFQNGKLYYSGAKEISEVELQDMITKEKIYTIDLSFLQLILSIMYTAYIKEFSPRDTITVRVPELARAMGMGPNINTKDRERIINKCQSYQTTLGVLRDKTRRSNSRYPVLTFEGYDSKTDTIALRSSYLIFILQLVNSASIRRDKEGHILLGTDGKPKHRPEYSHLVHSSIVKEKNKSAVENVFIIVTTIERAGNNTPHIRASNIIERNPQLKARLEKSTNPAQILKRTFEKTWELLRTKTDLTDTYNNIILPDPADPNNIPTLATLDMVFSFPHDGKKTIKKKKQASASGK